MNIEPLNPARDKHRNKNIKFRGLPIIIQYSIFVILLFCVASAWGQSRTNQPHVGYLYPAGGQQGAVIRVTAGGQFLRGITDVHISGEGVHAKVIKYIRPFRNLQKEQRELLQKRMKELREKRLGELSPGIRRRFASSRKAAAKKAAIKPKTTAPTAAKTESTADKEKATKAKEVKLPEHPLLDDLDDKSLRELAHVMSVLLFPRAKQQINRQLSELVLIEITIDPDAAPGNRELRLGTKTTLTNPMVFQVGLLPEVRELEPNNKEAYPALPNIPKTTRLPTDKPLELPVLLNGQIMPGDVDRFRFNARRGQRLVIEAYARGLIPYLADAVPGWFQATVALYDSNGREVAFADDYRFNPDPVLFYRIPRSGAYELEICDSIYRGREDFVYRLAVGERPFITQMFPLGAKAGVDVVASVTGWNLPETQLALDTQAGGACIRQTAYHEGKQLSNPVPYAVDTLPECNETESNDTTGDAQRIDLPKIINGRIDKPGDVDVFQFNARTDNKVVAEVNGRRLNSPLDSLLRLTDASGNVLEWNDDHMIKDSHLHMNMMGLATHHADSYLLAELPKNGTYYIHLTDSQRHGGQAFAYRLRIAVAQGDFALRVAPSSINMRTGGIIPIHVHALRKDGYDGEIEVVLTERNTGFELDGAQIPAGQDSVRMTLKAPPKAPTGPIRLQLEGRARIGGKLVSHPVVPADDVMQAFLYRHLVPSKELSVLVQKARWGMPPIELATDGPVRIPAGGSAQVRFKTPRRSNLKQVRLALREPPEGLTLHDLTVVPEGLAFQLRADGDAMESGYADNLIVEAFRESTPKPQKGKPTPPKRRYSMGVLPAIPILIVPQ
ncbi:MAG: hypothetical protein ACYSW0_07185 [Planctomycetota bacterium]